MKKITKVLAVAMACMMLFTACGNSGAGGTTQAQTGNEPAAGLPEKLIVGTNAEFPPFEFVNDAGDYDGFDLAVMEEVANRLGIGFEVRHMEFKGLIGAMGAGNINVIAAAMTVTADRQKSVDFTDSYYTANQYIVLQKDSDVTTFHDLDGKRVGVQEGTTGDLLASDEFDDSGEVGVKDAKVDRYKKGVDAILALKNGALDGVIIDANPAMEFTKANEDTLKYIADETSQEEYAFAVQKGDTVLLEAINGAIAEMREDGTFERLVAEYITQ